MNDDKIKDRTISFKMPKIPKGEVISSIKLVSNHQSLKNVNLIEDWRINKKK